MIVVSLAGSIVGGSVSRDAKPGDVRSVLQVGRLDVADVAVAVLLEVGMEGEGVHLLTPGICLARSTTRSAALTSALFGNEKSCPSARRRTAGRCRARGEVEALVELERGEDALGHVGERRFGRPCDPRRGPGCSLWRCRLPADRPGPLDPTGSRTKGPRSSRRRRVAGSFLSAYERSHRLGVNGGERTARPGGVANESTSRTIVAQRADRGNVAGSRRDCPGRSRQGHVPDLRAPRLSLRPFDVSVTINSPAFS